jgi:hypothetical protein
MIKSLIVPLAFSGVSILSIWALIASVHAAAAAPAIPCTSSPCQFSTNIAWDTAGTPDTRPSTWGNTAVVNSAIPFVNVPKGYAVQIVHVEGDEIAAPHGAMAANSMAYVLVGLTNSSPNQSPYVGPGLGSSGTAVYNQMPVPQSGGRIHIESSQILTLNADNLMYIKQALFLSTAGVSEHLEATINLRFNYISSALAAR